MSKIVDANKKIEEAVVGGYKKVEETVVGGYKKVEDKFVDTFLKKGGETIEETKERLQQEQQQRKNEQPKYSKTTEEIQAEIKEKYGK